MAVQGTFDAASLPEILQLFGNTRKTGRLSLQHEGAWTDLYFRAGSIVACGSNDPPKLLGQFLLFQGVIAEEQLRDALAEQQTRPRNFVEYLREHRLISEQDLERTLQEKAWETTLSVFDFERGKFEFVEGAEAHPSAVRVDYEIQYVCLEGMKRRDDMDRIRETLQREGTRPVRVAGVPPPPSGLSRPGRAVLNAVDGRRSVGEIALHTHGTTFLVGSILLELIDLGLVRLEEAGAGKSATVSAREAAGSEWDVLAELQGLLDKGRFEPLFDRIREVRAGGRDDANLRELSTRAEQAFLESLKARGFDPALIPIPGQDREICEEDELSASEAHLLTVCDGNWDVQSLMYVLPLREFEVLRAIQCLARRGLIRLIDPNAAPIEGLTAPDPGAILADASGPENDAEPGIF